MKSEDDKCFLWCIARALNPLEKDAERIKKALKIQADKFNMNEISYPVILKDIDKIRQQNIKISINVFGYEKYVYPLRISKQTMNNQRTVINHLLIPKGDKQHYCLVKI